MSDSNVTVRLVAEKDLDEAYNIVQLAFGTYMHVPDPRITFGDRDMVRKRAKDTSTALGAYAGEKLIGLNVVTRWGTFGWFGPLAVLPEYWDKDIGKKLMSATMNLYSDWGTTAEGLFTFSDSPKHSALYQKFGFYPRFLTAAMTKEASPTSQEYSTFSQEESKDEILRQCRDIANTVYPGLDLTTEIQSVYSRKLGDTVLLMDDTQVEGFAICHIGAGTEAGSNNCYVKFGAASSPEGFSKLANACIGFSASAGAQKVEAGVNLGRTKAYGEMKRLGFTTLFQGVAMQRPNEPGSNRPDVFAIDDWR